MTEVDDLLASLKEMRSKSIDQQEVIQKLVQIQNQVKYSNFHNLNPEKITATFEDIWLFLLFASSQTSNNAIRIATIRTAALFIFHLTPFFPNEMQKSFSTVAMISTIDVTESSLISAVFAYITFHIPTPLRNQFLASCPIFHHLTQGNQSSDYFISLLSHFRHLGIEWYRALVNTFLNKTMSEENDNLFWRGVVQIVSENLVLFKEVYDTIYNSKFYEKNIFFVKSLITIPDAPINQVDLYDIAEFSLNSLENVRNIKCNEKCSMIKILSLNNDSYKVEVSDFADNKITLDLIGIKQNKTFQKVLNIEDFASNPEFYLLDIPVSLLFPTGDEGPTLLAAKMTALIAKLKNSDDELTEKILDIVKNMVSKSYDTTVSSCFQGISNSAPLIDRKDVLLKLMIKLVDSIYCDSLSWFHDMDRLKVLNSIPLDILIQSVGMECVYVCFDQVLIWSKEKNEKLSAVARDVMLSFISQTDREILIDRIIHKCDIFDSFDLTRTLQLLNKYLENNARTVTLNGFCVTICQIFSLYPTIPELYIQICKFLSFFKLRKMKMQTLNICLAVIIASYQIITGLPAYINGIDETLVEDFTKMLNSVWSKDAFDIVHKNLNLYSDVNPFLAETLNLLLSIGRVHSSLIEPIVKYTINFFPYKASKFLYQNWNKLKIGDKIQILCNFSSIIKYDSGFDCAGIFFELYMKTVIQDKDSPEMKSTLALLKKFLNKSIEFYPIISEQTLLNFLHFDKFVHPKKAFNFDILPEPKRSNLIKLVNNENSELVLNDNEPDLIESQQYVSVDFKFEKPKVTTMEQLSQKLEYDNPLIEIQFYYKTCHYSEDEIRKMHSLYLEDVSCYSKLLNALEKYARQNNIELDWKNKEFNYDDLLKKEKLKKEDIISISKNIQFINPNEMLTKLLKIVTETTKEYNLKLLLITIGNVIQRIEGPITYEISHEIITNFNENFSKLPKRELLISLIPLCKNVRKSGRPLNFLNRLSTVIPLHSVCSDSLIRCYAYCQNLSNNDLKTNIKRLIESNSLPSLFISGVRLMLILFSSQPSVVVDLLVKFLPAFINLFERYNRIAPINTIVDKLFTSIFQKNNYSTLSFYLNYKISNFVIPQDANFVSYSSSFPCIIKYLMTIPTINAFSIIPNNSKIVYNKKVYFELIKMKIRQAEHKKELAIEKAQEFCKMIPNLYLVHLESYVNQWISILTQYTSFQNAVEIMIPIGNTQFNPFFLGTMRYIVTHNDKITDDEINFLFDWKIKTFSKAFKYALSRNSDLIKMGIKLSYFQDDCDESLTLISKTKDLYDKLKKSQ